MPEITAELRTVAVRVMRQELAKRLGIAADKIETIPDETVVGDDFLLLRGILDRIVTGTCCEVLLTGITPSLTVGDFRRGIEQSTGYAFYIRGAGGGRRRKNKTE